MNNDNSRKKNSGGVEVVADQADDGSYELRFERQALRDGAERLEADDRGEAEDDSLDKESESTGAWSARSRAHPAAARDDRTRLLILLVLVVTVALLVAAFLISSFATSRDPLTVEIEEPAFEGVFVETPPLVIEQMRLVERGDATDDASALDAGAASGAPAPQNEAAIEPGVGRRQIVPPVSADEGRVIDDVVKSALHEVTADEQRRRSAKDGDESSNPSRSDGVSDHEPSDESGYLPDEMAPGEEGYFEDEYDDEYYEDEGALDDEIPSDEPYRDDY